MCAILHNMLLEHDGRDKAGEFDGDWVNQDATESDPRSENLGFRYFSPEFKPLRPDANLDLMTTSTARGSLPLAPNVDTDIDVEVEVHPSFDEKRAALVNHFKYAKARGEVGWLAPAGRNRE